MLSRKPLGGPEGANPVLHCSFCNKRQAEVHKLIAGPSVYICDECVEVCNDILADDARFDKPSTANDKPKAMRQQTAPPSDPIAGAGERCALCRMPLSLEDALFVRERGLLCPGCIGEIEASIAETREVP